MSPEYESIGRRIASHLLRIQAVKLQPANPFRWSQGWISPIYCDNRVALSYPAIRTDIKGALAQLIRDRYEGVEAIVGVATAGIAQGALVADLLELPFAYARPEPKKHGMGNQLEGRLDPGARVVVLEDLISTGGSSLKVVGALRAGGIDVIGMAAIFSYGFSHAADNFRDQGVPLAVLSTYDDLIQVAVQEGYVTADQLNTLAEWRTSPDTWGN